MIVLQFEQNSFAAWCLFSTVIIRQSNISNANNLTTNHMFKTAIVKILVEQVPIIYIYIDICSISLALTSV
jgi:hypothetical protein